MLLTKEEIQMAKYIITKRYDKYNSTCLEYFCGTNKEHAEQIKADCEYKDPNGKYFIEEIQSEKQWWNQGQLD